jgi:hypothetical protein
MKVILLGKGRFLELKEPATVYRDPTVAIPRRGCVPLRPIKKRLCRSERRTEIMNAVEHTNYKPGKVYELGADQCRWVIDEAYTMCGKRKDGESSYCQHHHALTRAVWQFRP